MRSSLDGLGIVVIGRNEGERLIRCLRSVSAETVVYADSGSGDGSADRARSLGVAVVELDSSRPFSAARARNAGFDALSALYPGRRIVQFVDGDCEVQPTWLEIATRYLETHPEVAVVCGRRRERFPDASAYNRLVDIEWDVPSGDTEACGGDAMIRAQVFREVGGYDERLIAGEDPELCLRIRRSGHRVTRLDDEMTLHDADLRRFGQWWRRQVRSGHAYAEVSYLHGKRAGAHHLRRLVSIAIWGGALPGLSLLAAWPSSGWSLLLGAATLALPWTGAYRAARARGSRRDSAFYASACIVGKFAELIGAATFAWNRWIRRRATGLIEYKRAELRAPGCTGPADRRAGGAE
jgi:glycosyltransferase involved in cell wall biosynthesis